MSNQPFIVGVGGTLRPKSSSERALAIALHGAESCGVRTQLFGAADLQLPIYAPGTPTRTAEAMRLVEALSKADGVIISSPGYHGGVSGLIKNALDYVEDLRDTDRVYFDGLPVGCITTAAGWQSTMTTLMALRSIVHALRGWPSPLGVTINTAMVNVDDAVVVEQLQLLGRHVAEHACFGMERRDRGAGESM
jgi:FMN reductase